MASGGARDGLPARRSGGRSSVEQGLMAIEERGWTAGGMNGQARTSSNGNMTDWRSGRAAVEPPF